MDQARAGLSTYAVYGRRSHKMKQTQTHVWSLAGEKAVSYSLARGKAAAVTRESGEVAAYSLARAVSCTWAVPRRPGQRENTETVAKLPQPAQPRWGARPEDHVITNPMKVSA